MEINTQRKEYISFGLVDEDSEMKLSIEFMGHEETAYINADHAAIIINHLKEQFGI